MITIDQRLRQSNNIVSNALRQFGADLRVSSPAIIDSFNPQTQTCTAKIAITERIFAADGQSYTDEKIPLCHDVPVMMFRGGGFSITTPPKQGDECLLVFTDACFNYWYARGGIQGQQRRRRHDLSDAIAILGLWSQPNVLANLSATSLQIRSDDGQTVIDLANGAVTITAANVTVTGQNVKVTGSQKVDIEGSGQTTVEGRNFLQHVHVMGASTTGPVV